MSVKNSVLATHIPEKNAKIAGLSYIAPVDVRQTHIMPAVLSEASMNQAVNFLERKVCAGL